MKKRPNPETLVSEFNARVSVGDVIEYSEVIGIGDPVRFTTATPAQVLSGHTAVVWLVGKSGCVCVTHCKPVQRAEA
jgi:hypothetical protein